MSVLDEKLRAYLEGPNGSLDKCGGGQVRRKASAEEGGGALISSETQSPLEASTHTAGVPGTAATWVAPTGTPATRD
jgi:hypothetical protein